MRNALRHQQATFARHLRDPARHAPPPGLDARRLRLYRALFFDNIEALLASGFPVLRGTLGAPAWKALVHDFYATHRARTPLFTQVAAEFVAYLSAEHARLGLADWVAELADYEWIEQALFLADAPIPLHDARGDLADGVPLLSPHVRLLAYRWDVTALGPGHVPVAPPQEPTTLVVHRTRAQDVAFVRIAPLVYRLLARIDAVAASGRRHVAALADEAGVAALAIEHDALRALDALRAQGVILGTLPAIGASP